MISQGKNYLFIIGIDAYKHYDLLNNAVKDADDISDLLIDKYQFEDDNCIYLVNQDATKENILSEIRSLVVEAKPDDTILIYYSGHGDYDEVLNEGYWIPVEAKSEHRSDYISNSDLLKHFKSLKARHVVVFSDSCFSGSLMGRSRSSFFDKASNLTSRWCISSGRIEVVDDGEYGTNSPFAKAILTFLKNNNKKETRIKELITFLEEHVSNNSDQMPRGDRLRNSGDNGGEFFFHLNEKKIVELNKVGHENSMSEESKGEINYLESHELLGLIKNNFEDNFLKVFKIKNLEVNKANKNSISEKINDWENQVKEYSDEYRSNFNEKKINIYSQSKHLPDFKSKVFSQVLWTVSSALKTPDLELARYKKAFATTKPKALFDAFTHIVEKAENYINIIIPKIDFENLEDISDLQQDFFNMEDMLLAGVIGRGVRSEFLHRSRPDTFPIMTRKSHWGMYFLTNYSNEFIRYEKGSSKLNRNKTRIANQYKYDYPRFNYYSNELVLMLTEKLKPFDISLKHNIRYGYTNLFLSEIDSLNKKMRNELNKWK